MDRERTPRLQSDFYCIYYRRSVVLLLVLSLVSLFLTGFIGWKVLFDKQPAVYYAAAMNGQIIPLAPGGKGG